MTSRYLLLGGVLLCTAVPGRAAPDDVKIKPLVDARLRYEHVDQDGIAEAADALTLRVRPGLELSVGKHWSALVEGEATLAIVDRNNDGSNGKSAYPLVVDPRNAELNRAQLRYASPTFTLTAGRQLVELADQRFVGSSSFRQNQQTFDAARATWSPTKTVSLDLTYAWSARTVNGIHGTGARPISVGGDNVFALLSWKSKIGAVSGFAYLVDQDSAAVQGYRLSSQTYGARATGAFAVSPDWKLGYNASLARQSDWRNNPNRYAATYALGELTLSGKALTLTAGHEMLGASSGQALTSVQTPLASFFKWNGWAGKFNPTPPDGLRDSYGTVSHGWKKKGPFDMLSLGVTGHRFASDRLARRYGDELDLVAAAKYRRATFTARFAHYDAKSFATDTDKLWLSVDWVY
ncbi:MAG: alginate export family protein [Sphingobium sp.]|nr:alginate export family protein [Sphingobium sp.]